MPRNVLDSGGGGGGGGDGGSSGGGSSGDDESGSGSSGGGTPDWKKQKHRPRRKTGQSGSRSSSGGGEKSESSSSDESESESDGGIIDKAKSVAEDVGETVAEKGTQAVDRGRDVVEGTIGSGTEMVKGGIKASRAEAADQKQKIEERGEQVKETTTETASSAVNRGEEVVGAAKSEADEQIREASGGEVYLSDDITSTEDAQGARDAVDRGLRSVSGGDVYLSDDFTSREDSGGVLNTADAATGGIGGDLYRQSREEVTPHAQMALDDEGAVEARREKDRQMADNAAEGVEAIGSGELPDSGEVAGIIYTGSEMAERGTMGLGRGIAERSPTANMGPQITEGESVGDIPGHVVEGVIGGFGVGVGAVGQVAPSVAYDTEVMTRQRLGPRTDLVEETDLTTEGQEEGVAGMSKNIGESQVEMIKDRPVSTAALFALPAAEAAPAGVRGYRATKGTGGRKIKFEDVASKRSRQGEIPEFETATDAPTKQAVKEQRSRAGDQPDIVQETVGSEQVLWHSTGADMGRNLKVRDGASETPGLFVAGDVNPVGFARNVGTKESPSLSQRVRPSRPNMRTQTDRLVGFKGDKIEGMAESAQGSGYELRRPDGTAVERGLGRGEAKSKAADMSDVEVKPDQTTGTYRFMTEQADPGTAYVKPAGTRTTELEAIYGPGSEFKQTSRVGVEMPSGETIPAELFRGANDPPAGGKTKASGETGAETATESVGGDPLFGEVSSPETRTKTSTETATADTPHGEITSPSSRTKASTEPTISATEITQRSRSSRGEPVGFTDITYTAAAGATGQPTAISASETVGSEPQSPPAETVDGDGSGGATQPGSAGSALVPGSAPSGSGSGSSGSSTQSSGSRGPSSTSASGSSGGPPSSTSTRSLFDDPTKEDSRPRRRRDDDQDKKSDRLEGLFGGDAGEDITDFLNPLSGDVIRTDGADQGGLGWL